MYELNSRVRYSETDIDAKLSLTGIMNYMQDCSTMQSEDAGVGIGYLGREKKAWLLSSWQIVIERRPVLGERIKVVTWPYAVKGLYALRNFAILDENGGYLVKAKSYWFLMNTETGRPMRILESDTAPYGEFSPKIEMEDAGRKIAVPKEMEETGRLVVMKHLLDTNLHVNNAQYVVFCILDLLRVPFNVNAVFLLNLFKLFSLFLNKFFNLLFTFRGETASDKFQQFPDLGDAADIQKFFKMNSH